MCKTSSLWDNKYAEQPYIVFLGWTPLLHFLIIGTMTHLGAPNSSPLPRFPRPVIARPHCSFIAQNKNKYQLFERGTLAAQRLSENSAIDTHCFNAITQCLLYVFMACRLYHLRIDDQPPTYWR